MVHNEKRNRAQNRETIELNEKLDDRKSSKIKTTVKVRVTSSALLVQLHYIQVADVTWLL